MGAWNYRIVRHGDGTLTLNEVHYEGGRPVAMTEDPAGFVASADEGPAGIVEALRLALKAAEKPVLDRQEILSAKGHWSR
jgi:hypothetical protein